MRAIAFSFLAFFAGASEAQPLFGDDEATVEFSDAHRIVGGNDTTIESHPYQMSLRSHNEHLCGGSILTATSALTAGHCIVRIDKPSDSIIMAGSTLCLGDANQQLRTVNRLLLHPKYFDPDLLQNDVALVYWEQPLTFGANVRAITLPPHGSPAPYGEQCNVTGWGILYEGGPSPNVLQVATTLLVSSEECKKVYGNMLKPDMICAGLPQGGHDACTGDSGSPLTVNGVQLGVTSWNEGCAVPRHPTVYARVAVFTKWIEENI